MSKKRPSMRELEHRANQGDVKAAFQLYENYRDGSFVEQDGEKSTYYAAKALEGFSDQSLAVESIKLVGFRAFFDVEIPLLSHGSNDEKLVVIVGVNGAGKTAILDALSKCLHWVTLRVTKRRNSGSVGHIDELDIHCEDGVVSEYAAIVADLHLNSGLQYNINLSKSRDDSNRERKNNVQTIGQLGSLYKFSNEENPDFNMPLISYYSTERTVGFSRADANKALGDLGDKQHKFDAYEGALDAAVNFVVFFKWFKYQEELATLESGIAQEQSKKTLMLIVRVVECFLPELTNLRVQRSPVLDLLVDKSGTTLSVRQLSQGEKSLFALVVDIAQRLVLLNPSLNDPLAGAGVVLIDEIDLHLHPEWQQKVIPNLRNTFKNIQFIVTTHSPQVLTTVKRENIRALGKGTNGEIVVEIPKRHSYGEPSNAVLQSIMLVDPLPPTQERELLQRLTSLVDQGLYDDDEAVALFTKLKKHLSDKHPQLQKLERSICRQKALAQ